MFFFAAIMPSLALPALLSLARTRQDRPCKRKFEAEKTASNIDLSTSFALRGKDWGTISFEQVPFAVSVRGSRLIEPYVLWRDDA